MAEPTHTREPGTDPEPDSGSTAVVVDTIERQSAPPIPVWACAPCREQRHLTPLADQW